MSRFYASVSNNRSTVTKRGFGTSGLSAHIRGWNKGVRVELFADGEKDVIRVYETGGSASGSTGKLLASIGG